MPSKPNGRVSNENAVKKNQVKSVDGCNTCPPAKGCEGAEISFEVSGCLDGGGSFTLRQNEAQVIPFHVECPGNGKLTITTAEELTGGGEFTANQFCGTDIKLGLNNEWLDRFVGSRIGNGKLTIGGDATISGDGEFTANQANDTNVVLKVQWDTFPACGGSGGLEWNGTCWSVDWDKFPACSDSSIQLYENCWSVNFSKIPFGSLLAWEGDEDGEGKWDICLGPLVNAIEKDIIRIVEKTIEPLKGVRWSDIVGRPSCFDPCEHTHRPNPSPEPKDEIIEDQQKRIRALEVKLEILTALVAKMQA